MFKLTQVDQLTTLGYPQLKLAVKL